MLFTSRSQGTPRSAAAAATCAVIGSSRRAALPEVIPAEPAGQPHGQRADAPSLACVGRVPLRQDEPLEADRQQSLRSQPLHVRQAGQARGSASQCEWCSRVSSCSWPPAGLSAQPLQLGDSWWSRHDSNGREDAGLSVDVLLGSTAGLAGIIAMTQCTLPDVALAGQQGKACAA